MARKRLRVNLHLLGEATSQLLELGEEDGQQSWTVNDVCNECKVRLKRPELTIVAPKKKRKDGDGKNRLKNEVVVEDNIMVVDARVQQNNPDGVIYMGAHNSVSLQPKAEMVLQDVSKNGNLVNMLELLDNSISALLAARSERPKKQTTPELKVTVSMVENSKGWCLQILDNGIGMLKEVVEGCLQMSNSYSAGPPKITRSAKPLEISQYINGHVSRFGRGMASTMSFGSDITVVSKRKGAEVAHGVTCSLKEWTQAQVHNIPDAVWKGTPVTEVLTSGGWADESYTRVTISNLRPDVLASLSSPVALDKLIKQISNTYTVTLYGLPTSLTSKMPDAVRGSPRNLLGGITLSAFGQRLPSKGQQTPGTLVTSVTDAWAELQKQHPKALPFVLSCRWVPECKAGAVCDDGGLRGGGPGSSSGGAAVEYIDVDEAMVPNTYWKKLCRVAKGTDKPRAGTGSILSGSRRGSSGGRGGKGRGGGGRGGEAGRATSGKRGAPASASTTPAAQRARKENPKTPNTAGASGRSTRARDAGVEEPEEVPEDDYVSRVHHLNTGEEVTPNYVDFLLVLFYFPMKNGLYSKPDPAVGALPLWSGRIMPRDPLCLNLPALVKAASEQGRQQSMVGWSHLEQGRIGGLLFISPDCSAGHSKEQVRDAAYDAMAKLGGQLGQASASAAVDMLDLGQKGGLHTYDYDADAYVPPDEGKFAVNMLLNHFDLNWRALDDEGNLGPDRSLETDVNHVTWIVATTYEPPMGAPYSKLSKGDLVRISDETEAGTASTDKQGSKTHLAACKHYKIVRFRRLPESDGTRILADLQAWRPSWATPAPFLDEPVVNLRPVEMSETKRKGEQDKLCAIWEEEAPWQLAYTVSGSGSGKATLDQRHSESLCPFADNIIPVGLLKQLNLTLATKTLVCKERKSYTCTKKTVSVHVSLFNQEVEVWQANCPANVGGYSVTVRGFDEHLNAPGDWRFVLTPCHSDGWLPTPPLALECRVQTVAEGFDKHDLVASWMSEHKTTGSGVPGTPGSTKGKKQRGYTVVRVGQPLPPILLLYERGGKTSSLPNTASSYKVVADIDDTDENPAARQVTLPALSSWKLKMTQVDGQDLPTMTGYQMPVTVMKPHKDYQQVKSTLRVKLSVYLLDSSQAAGSNSRPRAGASKAATGDVVALASSDLEVYAAGDIPAEWCPWLPPNTPAIDISKGAPLPDGLGLTLVDKHGIPSWLGLAPDSKPSRGQTDGPKARIILHGVTCIARAGEPEFVVLLVDGGDIKLHGDEYCGSGVMSIPNVEGREKPAYSIQVVLAADSLPESLRPRQAISYSFPLTITRNSLTFLSPLLPDDPVADPLVDPRVAAVFEAAQGTSQSQSQCVAAWLLDLLPRFLKLKGANRVKTLTDFSDVLKGLQALRPDVFVRPNGRVYRGADWQKGVVADATAAATSDRVYEAVLVCGHTCTEIEGVKIQMCTYDKDETDPSYCAPFRVVIAGTELDIYAQPQGPPVLGNKQGMQAKQPNQCYALQPLNLLVNGGSILEAFKGGQHTVGLHVTDNDDTRAIIGTFYLRQAPRPVSIHLLPTSPCVLRQLASGDASAAGSSSASSGLTFVLQVADHVADPAQSGLKVRKELSNCSLQPSSEWLAAIGAVALAPAAAAPSAKRTRGSGKAADKAAEQEVEGSGSARWSAGRVPPGWDGTQFSFCLNQTTLSQPAPIHLAHDRIKLKQPLQVSGGEIFVLHFMLCDQFNTPLSANKHVQQHIRGTAEVSAVVSGANANKRRGAACIVDIAGWTWDMGRTGRDDQLSSWVPVQAVALRVTAGRGQLALTLTCKGVGAVPGALVTSEFSLSVQVVVVSGATAPDGLNISLPPAGGMPGLQLQSYQSAQHLPTSILRGHRAAAAAARGGAVVNVGPGSVDGDAAGGWEAILTNDHVPKDARLMVVHFPDGGTAFDLLVTLRDEHDNPASSSAAPTLEHLPGWAGPAGLVADLVSAATKSKGPLHLRLSAPKFAAEACQSSPQMLLLRAPGEAAVRPVLVVVVVTEGTYPARLLPLMAADPWGELSTWTGVGTPQPGQALPHVVILWEGVCARAKEPLHVPTSFRLENGVDLGVVVPRINLVALTKSGLVVPGGSLAPVTVSWEILKTDDDAGASQIAGDWLSCDEPAPMQVSWTQDVGCAPIAKLHEVYFPSNTDRTFRVSVAMPGVAAIHLGPFHLYAGNVHHVWAEPVVEKGDSQLEAPKWLLAWAVPQRVQAVPLEMLREVPCRAGFPKLAIGLVDERDNVCISNDPLLNNGLSFQLRLHQVEPSQGPTQASAPASAPLASWMVWGNHVKHEPQSQKFEEALQIDIPQLSLWSMSDCAGPVIPFSKERMQHQRPTATEASTTQPTTMRTEGAGQHASHKPKLAVGETYRLEVVCWLPPCQMAAAYKRELAVAEARDPRRVPSAAALDAVAAEGLANGAELPPLLLSQFYVIPAAAGELQHRVEQAGEEVSRLEQRLQEAQTKHKKVEAVEVQKQAVLTKTLQEQERVELALQEAVAGAVQPRYALEDSEPSIEHQDAPLAGEGDGEDEADGRPFSPRDVDVVIDSQEPWRGAAAGPSGARGRGPSGQGHHQASGGIVRVVATAAQAARVKAYRPRNVPQNDPLNQAGKIIRDLKAFKVLGPIAMLLRCERLDVARALSAHVGKKLRTWVVVDKDARIALIQHFSAGQQISLMTLGYPEMADSFTRAQCDTSHPQLPLLMPQSKMVGDALAENPHAFVGYAVNLVHLPLGLMKMQVEIGGHGRAIFNLRQSLAYYLFTSLMVFETDAGMDGFVQRMRSQNNGRLERQLRCVSLQGGNANLAPGMESFGNQYSSTALTIGGLGREEQSRLPYPLDLQLRAGKMAKDKAEQLNQELAALQQKVQAAINALAVTRDERQRSAQNLAGLQEEVIPLLIPAKSNLEALQHDLRMSLRHAAS